MGQRPLLISPSLLACDFGHLAEEIQRIQDAGADWLHIDVMDGHFVPNLTMGPVVVEAIRRVSRIPLDVHLMLDDPQRYVGPFIDAGADMLTVHVEAPGAKPQDTLLKVLASIRRGGIRSGLCLRPRTNPERLKPYLQAVDLLVVMSVEPGFGGQAFLPEAIPHVRQLRQWYDGDLAVDGGINATTGLQMREAGANVLVAGTYVFRCASYREAIQALRGARGHDRDAS
jgi:ribulose-phosphate 3-epimerase